MKHHLTTDDLDAICISLLPIIKAELGEESQPDLAIVRIAMAAYSKGSDEERTYCEALEDELYKLGEIAAERVGWHNLDSFGGFPLLGNLVDDQGRRR